MEKKKMKMRVSGQFGPDMSDDPRSMRTRAALKQALMQLLRGENWDGITVIAICRHAGVARSSFYEHFDTKADLLDEIFADMLGDIPLNRDQAAHLGTLDWLVAHVNEAPDFFAHAMAGRRGDALLPRFREALIRRLEQELATRGVRNPAAAAVYIIGGSMAYLAGRKCAEPQKQLQNMALRIVRAF